MNKRTILTAATTTFAVTFLLASSAHATLLTPGAAQVPITTFAGSLGSLLADTGVQNYSTVVAGTPTQTEKGTYEARVFQSGAFLNFVYDFTNSGRSNVSLQKATMANFAGFATDVFYLANTPAAGSINPAGANLTADGKTVTFFFSPTTVNPGQTASEMIIQVRAPYYTTGNYSIQNGVTTNLSGYQPSSVPEPASMAMIGAGLLALGIFRRKLA